MNNLATKQIVTEDETAESLFWEALELDKIGDRMKASAFHANSQIFMATGRTHNACEMCDGSCTTHGCNGCG